MLSKMRANSAIFRKKLPKINSCPMGRKVAESGRPGWYQCDQIGRIFAQQVIVYFGQFF
jgi:hypothetical protein